MLRRTWTPEQAEQARDFVCPIKFLLDILSPKWTVDILRELFIGPVRSRQFLTLIPGLNMKTLQERLEMLAGHELIQRSVLPGRPVGVEYSLTAKGREVYSVLVSLKQLGSRWSTSTCTCPFELTERTPDQIECPHRPSTCSDCR